MILSENKINNNRNHGSLGKQKHIGTVDNKNGLCAII